MRRCVQATVFTSTVFTTWPSIEARGRSKIPSLTDLFAQRMRKHPALQPTEASPKPVDQNGWKSEFPEMYKDLEGDGVEPTKPPSIHELMQSGLKFGSGRTHIAITRKNSIASRTFLGKRNSFTALQSKKYQYVNSMLLFLTDYSLSLEQIVDYGCYCAPVSLLRGANHAEGEDKAASEIQAHTPEKGTPMDRIDKICRQHRLCTGCINITEFSDAASGASDCDAIEKGYWFQGGMSAKAGSDSKFIKCLNDLGSCARRVCECDRKLAMELAASTNELSSEILDLSQDDRDQACKKVTSTESSRSRESGPSTFLLNQASDREHQTRKLASNKFRQHGDAVEHKCCVKNEYGQLYNGLNQECCDDGLPRHPGTCPL